MRGWGGGWGGVLPAGLGRKSNWVVGDDCPDEGLHKGNWQAQCRSGYHKRPSWEKHVVPLLEEHRHSVNLRLRFALSDRCPCAHHMSTAIKPKGKQR